MGANIFLELLGINLRGNDREYEILHGWSVESFQNDNFRLGQAKKILDSAFHPGGLSAVRNDSRRADLQRPFDSQCSLRAGTGKSVMRNEGCGKEKGKENTGYRIKYGMTRKERNAECGEERKYWIPYSTSPRRVFDTADFQRSIPILIKKWEIWFCQFDNLLT